MSTNFPQIGTFGWIVMKSNRNTIVESKNGHEHFPLASAAKLFIGAIVTESVEKGELYWEQLVSNVQFDPKEDSHLLFSHLQGRSQIRLREVVEVMIACHDHFCANTLANELGGWRDLADRISSSYGNTQIDQNPRDIEKNYASLVDISKLLLNVCIGYRSDPKLWEPVVTGLLLQQDKVETLPKEECFNLTGGLPNALIDVGILRGFSDEDQLIYAVAGKDLPERAKSNEADHAVASMIHDLYYGSDK